MNNKHIALFVGICLLTLVGCGKQSAAPQKPTASQSQSQSTETPVRSLTKQEIAAYDSLAQRMLDRFMAGDTTELETLLQQTAAVLKINLKHDFAETDQLHASVDSAKFNGMTQTDMNFFSFGITYFKEYLNGQLNRLLSEKTDGAYNKDEHQLFNALLKQEYAAETAQDGEGEWKGTIAPLLYSSYQNEQLDVLYQGFRRIYVEGKQQSEEARKTSSQLDQEIEKAYKEWREAILKGRYQLTDDCKYQSEENVTKELDNSQKAWQALMENREKSKKGLSASMQKAFDESTSELQKAQLVKIKNDFQKGINAAMDEGESYLSTKDSPDKIIHSPNYLNHIDK